MPRQTGLKNVYIALVTKDDETGCTYGIPEKLERGLKATLKPKNTSTKLYSDDAVEEILNAFDSVDVSIELNQLSLASRARLQGARVVKGQLVESRNDIAPTLALGFQSKKSNGAQRFVWLLKGSFQTTDDGYETEADKIKDQTASLAGTFYARNYDGNYRMIADSDAPNVDTAVIAAWFTSVPIIPTGATTTTITVVPGMSGVLTGIAGTVATVKTGSTVIQLKNAILVDGGKGSFKIWSSAAKTTLATDIATVVNTMVIEVTAEDGATRSVYSIVVA